MAPSVAVVVVAVAAVAVAPSVAVVVVAVAAVSVAPSVAVVGAVVVAVAAAIICKAINCYLFYFRGKRWQL